jgi:predicted nuclease of restriction endonuclease-like (RecB) superfamily
MTLETNYKEWLSEWKKRIKSAQIKAAIRVNAELLGLYWELGRDIAVKQENSPWGTGLIPRMAKDLKRAFPDLTGFSQRNLFYVRKWYLLYRALDVMMPTLASPLDGAIVQQLAAQLEGVDKEVFVAIFFTPWGHHQVIIDKCKTIDAAIFYLKKSVQQGWSRKQLQRAIAQNLYARQGKAITNFEWTLPHPESALAVETLKNPYNFDFLRLGAEARERDIEEAMMRHIEKVLIELGQGFALVGRQYKVVVDSEAYSIDLLFYHTRLHCYVVVDLKAGSFKPEYAGKINFYCSAVDDLLRTEPDQPTTLPDSLKGILPTTEELERELDENLNSEKHRKNQDRP